MGGRLEPGREQRGVGGDRVDHRVGDHHVAGALPPGVRDQPFAVHEEPLLFVGRQPAELGRGRRSELRTDRSTHRASVPFVLHRHRVSDIASKTEWERPVGAASLMSRDDVVPTTTRSARSPGATRTARAARRAMLERTVGSSRSRVPDTLPIADRADELIAAIHEHQVVIVAGETGSGKSTQLPKLCLLAGRGVDGMIGHTQPRRVAARTVAERVADEIGTNVGEAVGYTVRFNDRVGDGTLLRVMTDGILLNELQRDRMLRRYDTLIIDEAHERSLNIDFILGYLKQLLPKRPDLKVIVTSATIDTDRFAEHFATDGVPGARVRRRGSDVPGRGPLPALRRGQRARSE